uniref:peptidyl-tRNA hydrolase n=1 Tax=Lutzomyia longipalpis TaxID=7200 RepID=A0A1B0CL56_LUTLO
MSRLIQCLIVRKDLPWPPGALIAQACHASSAINHTTIGEAREAFGKAEGVKISIMEVENQEALQDANDKLSKDGVDFKLWTEQPENFPTCICLKIYPEEFVEKYLKEINAEKVL